MKQQLLADVELRDAFFNELYSLAQKDRNIILLSDDFGAPSLDKFRHNLSDQYINIGISEQNMVSVAAGLALSGKKVYLYAIAPFVTLRCFEQIKIDLSCMNLPVTAVGVGAGYAYGTTGPTHHATEDIAVMRVLPNVTIFNPSDAHMAAAIAKISYEMKGPTYIRFDRGKLPLHYTKNDDFSTGMQMLSKGTDLGIISTGPMINTALEISEELSNNSIKTGVIDIYRLKPVNTSLLTEMIRSTKRLVTVEEHVINGGLGSIVAEILSDAGLMKPLKRFAIEDCYCFNYGKRNLLQAQCGLDVRSIVNTIEEWIR